MAGDGLMDDRFIEADVKEVFLENESLFPNIGKSTVIYEKAILRGNTIMDIMLCTERKGVIGIEIKTERDSTNRLNKQLADYEKVCDYVYVLCHDSHVNEVEKILKRHNHAHVGIIAYIRLKDKPFLGIYRVAQISPYKNVYHTLDILWKKEIQTLLGTFAHYGRRITEAEGLKSQNYKSRGQGFGETYVMPTHSAKMRKSTLVNELINRLGADEANKVFCHIFINNEGAPEKSIKLHHFKLDKR